MLSNLAKNTHKKVGVVKCGRPTRRLLVPIPFLLTFQGQFASNKPKKERPVVSKPRKYKAQEELTKFRKDRHVAALESSGVQANPSKSPDFSGDEEGTTSLIINLFEEAAKKYPTLFVKRNLNSEWKVSPRHSPHSLLKPNKLLGEDTAFVNQLVAREASFKTLLGSISSRATKRRRNRGSAPRTSDP